MNWLGQFKSGSSPFSADQLRFSRTIGAFYLSCGRFLDAKSWPLELDINLKAAAARRKTRSHDHSCRFHHPDIKSPAKKRGIFFYNSSFFSSNAGNFSFLGLPSFITKKYKESNVIRKTIKNGYGE